MNGKSLRFPPIKLKGAFNSFDMLTPCILCAQKNRDYYLFYLMIFLTRYNITMDTEKLSVTLRELIKKEYSTLYDIRFITGEDRPRIPGLLFRAVIVSKAGDHSGRFVIVVIDGVPWIELKRRINLGLMRMNRTMSGLKNNFGTCPKCKQNIDKNTSCMKCGGGYCVGCYYDILYAGGGIVTCPYKSCRFEFGEISEEIAQQGAIYYAMRSGELFRM